MEAAAGGDYNNETVALPRVVVIRPGGSCRYSISQKWVHDKVPNCRSAKTAALDLRVAAVASGDWLPCPGAVYNIHDPLVDQERLIVDDVVVTVCGEDVNLIGREVRHGRLVLRPLGQRRG